MELGIIDPNADADTRRQRASFYTQILLDFKREPDISPYIPSALRGTPFVLPALANSAKDLKIWPKIRDAGGVKLFCQFASKRHDGSSEANPNWTTAVLGIVNSLFGIQQTQEADLFTTEDAAAYQEILSCYPDIIKTVWEDRDLILGDTASTPRAFLAMMLFKLGITDTSRSEIIREPLTIPMALHIYFSATELDDREHATAAFACILRDTPTEEQLLHIVDFASKPLGGITPEKGGSRALWNRVMTLMSQPERSERTLSWSFKIAHALCTKCAPSDLLMAALEENVGTITTIELAKSASRSHAAIDMEDILCFVGAGAFYNQFLDGYASDHQTMIMMTMFTPPADWVLVACAVMFKLAQSGAPSNALTPWSNALHILLLASQAVPQLGVLIRQRFRDSRTGPTFDAKNSNGTLPQPSACTKKWLRTWKKVLSFLSDPS